MVLFLYVENDLDELKEMEGAKMSQKGRGRVFDSESRRRGLLYSCQSCEKPERLELKMGAECCVIEKAKNRNLPCTKDYIHKVDLITCGAFLYSWFVYLFLFFVRLSPPASAVQSDVVVLHSVTRPKAACRLLLLLVEVKRFTPAPAKISHLSETTQTRFDEAHIGVYFNLDQGSQSTRLGVRSGVCKAANLFRIDS